MRYYPCVAAYRGEKDAKAVFHAYPVILQLDPVNPDMSAMGAILVQTNKIKSYNVDVDSQYGGLEDRPPRAFTEVCYRRGSFASLNMEFQFFFLTCHFSRFQLMSGCGIRRAPVAHFAQCDDDNVQSSFENCAFESIFGLRLILRMHCYPRAEDISGVSSN